MFFFIFFYVFDHCNIFFSSLFWPYLAAETLTRCSVRFIGMGLFTVSRVEAHILGSLTHNGAVPSMLAVMSSLTAEMIPRTVSFHPH